MNEEHGELQKDISVEKEKLRHLENETLDALIERWMPVALGKKNSQFALRAVDRVIRLIEQRCRINGLYQEISSNDDYGQSGATIEQEILKFVYNNVGTPQGMERGTIERKRLRGRSWER